MIPKSFGEAFAGRRYALGNKKVGQIILAVPEVLDELAETHAGDRILLRQYVSAMFAMEHGVSAAITALAFHEQLGSVILSELDRDIGLPYRRSAIPSTFMQSAQVLELPIASVQVLGLPQAA